MGGDEPVRGARPGAAPPGRFDRQVSVDLPDVVGRAEILRIHSRAVNLAPDADMATVARITSGFSGADLANVVYEAALLAARKEKESVGPGDFDEAIERVVAGSERRTRVMNEHEKAVVATHEAGHALQNVYDYLVAHSAYINYEKFKELGLPLGSGMVESACKWLIQQRFKGVGMRWSEDGFNHLLHLRLAWVNDRFDALFLPEASPNV
jgi:hypothetical protein